MNILSDEAIHSKLLLNLPIYVEGIGEFHAPKVNDIIDYTEENYMMSLNALFFDKSNLQDPSQNITDLQLLLHVVSQDINFKEHLLRALSMHFEKKPMVYPDGFIYFGEVGLDNLLTEEKLIYIKKLIKIANNIPEKTQEEEYKAGNERARKFIEKLMKNRAEINKVKKQKISLRSIVSSIGWKTEKIESVGNLTIYQLYDGLYRLRNIDGYTFTMVGMYMGTVDGTKIKLEDIHWSNIIEIK